MTRTIHYCNFCDYKSDRRYDRDKHVTRKHGNDHSTQYLLDVTDIYTGIL